LEKEIDEKNPALSHWDELILKQQQARKRRKFEMAFGSGGGSSAMNASG
jgi:hypothetical protein